MANLIKKLLAKKFLTAGVILALVGISYYGYNLFFGNKNATRYVTATAEKGTLIVSITGSGQVSAFNQVDIKPKVSGDIVYVGVKNGQEVKTGMLLVQIDARDAQKTVRDAEVNLESAKLSLEKLKQPADQLSILQVENALTSARNNLEKLKLSQQTNYQKAQESKQKAEDDLKKAYEDGFNNVANVFLDLPTVMAGLQDILFGYNFSFTQQNLDYYADAVKNYDEKVMNYKTDAYDKYQTARKVYDKNFQDYKSASRFSDTSVIESLIEETYETDKTIAEAIKSTNNLIQFYQDKLTERNLKPATLSTTHLSSLNTYTSKTNTHLLNLLSIKSSIQTDKKTITNIERDLKEMDQNNPLDLAAAEATVKEKETSLAKLKAGPDALDIQSQELIIKQRENALLDAKEKLANYFIRAPFDGIIAKVNVKKGDPVSGSIALVTLITKQRMAEVSLNEVDAAKIKIGQKATLTFDALPDLSITGEVAEIETIGTVSQGVVSYTIKIIFDTQDERIKPDMSVSAAIITDVKQNVLLVPNAAIKQQGETAYVEIFAGENQTPRQQIVQTGLSNDTVTEIISGLSEGDKVVTQTITPNTSQKQTQTNPALRIPGMRGGFR